MLDHWFFWAALSSFAMAVIAHFNHRRHLDPQLLNAWHSTFAALILLAAFPFAIWPVFSEHKDFYLVAAGNAVVMALGMIFFFKLSLQRTGRVTSMTIPLAVVAAYVAWWMMEPESHPRFVESPWRGYVSTISILLVCFAMQKFRSNDASWETFRVVLPLGVAFGVRDAFVKWLLAGEMNVYATALAFTMLSVCLWALFAWLAAMPKPPGGRARSKFFEGNLLWGSFWCGFWTVIVLLCGVIALTRAPNPAYPGMIMALTPVWLYAHNYFRRVRDEVSPAAGALIILGALGLLLSTL